MADGEAPRDAVGAELLPDYREWLLANPGSALGAYACLNVSADRFFAVAALLSPRTVEHRGGLFLADGFEHAGHARRPPRL